MKSKIYFMLIGFVIFIGVMFNLVKYVVYYFLFVSVVVWWFGIVVFVMVLILGL